MKKNKILETYKNKFAIKKGFSSWNDLRMHTRLQDCFRYLNEIAEIIIEELATEINNLKTKSKTT